MAMVDIKISIPAEAEEDQAVLEERVREKLRQRPDWDEETHFYFDSFQWRGHGYDVTVFTSH